MTCTLLDTGFVLFGALILSPICASDCHIATAAREVHSLIIAIEDSRDAWVEMKLDFVEVLDNLPKQVTGGVNTLFLLFHHVSVHLMDEGV